MKLLEGKVAIVTGAARGIGAGIVLKFAEQGADIAFTYVSDSSAEKARSLEEKLLALGVKAKAYKSNASLFAEGEIFVSEGLDSALNIDRESFNHAHPHSVYITKWLHGALRQLATAQKKLASEARDQSRDENKDIAVSGIQRVAIDVWTQEADDPASRPPPIEISDTGRKAILKVAQIMEELGVAAYNGAGIEIMDKAILGVAGQIVQVEARHTGLLRALNNVAPADAFPKAMTPQEVVTAVTPVLGPEQ